MGNNNNPEKLGSEIPEKIISIMEADSTATEIAQICLENELKDEWQIKEISYQIGRVLLGDLPPNELSKTIGEKIKIPSFVASKISQEIQENILSLIKEKSSMVSDMETTPTEKPLTRTPKTRTEESERTDTYRELIE